jgi:hypothetical protein
MSGIKRDQDADSEDSPERKKLRRVDLADDIAAAQQDLAAPAGATDGPNQVSNIEQQQETDLAGGITNERDATQFDSTSPASGFPSFDPLNPAPLPLPMIPGIGTFQGIMPPGTVQQQFLANPAFGFQVQGPWQSQASLLHGVLHLGQEQPHHLDDQPGQQPNSPTSQDNHELNIGTHEEPNEKPNSKFPKSDDSGVVTSSLQPAGDDDLRGDGIGNASGSLDDPMHLHISQFQHVQHTQASVQPQAQHTVQQNVLPMPANPMQYPQMFPAQLPLQSPPGISDTDAAAFASRNRMMFPQFPPIAGGMTPPFFPSPMSPMGVQRPFMVQPIFRPVGIPLALSCDVDQLSEYQILVRRQLEIFEATQEDVESNTQGRKKQVVLGQIGIRCRHCAGFPLRQRGRGAVYYPAKLQGKSR